jgi:hypothetical protein
VLANSSKPGNVLSAVAIEDVVAWLAAADVDDAIVLATSAVAAVVVLADSSVDVEEIALFDGAHAANKMPPSPRPPSRKALRRSRTCSCS